MNLDHAVSLGFGTSQIGGPSRIAGQLTGCKPIPKQDAIRLLEYAHDNGVNFFDTSNQYGAAESLIGNAFQCKRERILIATKCGINEQGVRDFSVNYVRHCLESSLVKLKTDYIDVYQLAKAEHVNLTDELMTYISKKLEDGTVRHFGISTKGVSTDRKLLKNRLVSSYQVFYNLLFVGNRRFIDDCSSEGKFVIVRSPLNSGLLSGAYTARTKFAHVDSRRRYFTQNVLTERLFNLKKILGRFEISPNECLSFSLNFLFSNPSVNVVIPAASNLEQLRNYLATFRDAKRLDNSQVKEITKYIEQEIQLTGGGQVLV